MGLTDYYIDSYTGGTGATVMMDRNEGDEDCFSKMLLGWTKPQIVTESCYVTLASSSVTADAAVIAPTSWDGNFLSEYFFGAKATTPLFYTFITLYHIIKLKSILNYPYFPFHLF